MKNRIVCRFLDTVLVYLGFTLGLWLRNSRLNFSSSTFQDNFYILPILTIISVLTMVFVNAYPARFKSGFLLLKTTFISWIVGILVSMSFMYVLRERWGSFPSSIFLISFPIILVFLAASRLVVYMLSGDISRKVIFLNEAGFKNLDALLNEAEIDEIVLTVHIPSVKQLYHLLKIAELKNARLCILPKLYDEIVAKRVNGKDKPLFIPQAYFKNSPEESLIRLCDVLISVVLLFMFLPFLAIIALLIRVDSPCGVIYKQLRVGQNGKEFMLYKFRSMVMDAPQFSRPGHLALQDDARVTKMGRFMRKFRIDEIPQIFNVIKGDMSLVGPRPEAVYRVREHRALQGIRLSLKPGLTGLAQVIGLYHTVPRHKLRYDYLYINKRSLRLNLVILFKTVPSVLFRPGS